MFHLEQFVTLLEYDPKVGALRVGERGGLMRVGVGGEKGRFGGVSGGM